MSDVVPTVSKERSQAAEDVIMELKRRGFSPADACEILLTSSVTLAQLSSTLTKENFLEAVAETWDGLAAIKTSKDADGKSN